MAGGMLVHQLSVLIVILNGMRPSCVPAAAKANAGGGHRTDRRASPRLSERHIHRNPRHIGADSCYEEQTGISGVEMNRIEKRREIERCPQFLVSRRPRADG
jgi:hypothetical protein